MSTKRYQLFSFIALVFLISWITWVVAFQAGRRVVSVHIGGLAFHFDSREALDWIGNFVPGFAALFVIRVSEGWTSTKRFLSLTFAVNSSPLLYAMALFLPLVIVFPCLLAYGLGSFNYSFGLRFLLETLANLPLAPFWEELGWRGYLFPRVQSSVGTLRACFFVGFVWAVWHLPIRLFTGPTGVSPTFSFGFFCAYICGLAFILGWLYNRSGGSLVPAIIFHSAANSAQNLFIVPVASKIGLRPLAITTLAIFAVAFALHYCLPNRRVQQP